MINIKSNREIEIMKESCQLAARTLNFIEDKIQAGMTTEDVNEICHKFITENGAYPSPLNYNGFPKSVCTSLNDVICHGIPSKKDKIKEGDILNVDVTTYYKNFHGDTNRTYFVGHVDPEIKRLVKVTYECMMAGIELCKPGARIGDIGAVIEEMAHDNGFSVVHEYCGHGIGREFHEDPQILHYGTRGTGVEMKPGMTFTIEPMINLGKRHCKLLKDGWTVVTKDKKPSAQFEHTILITESGFEILTLDPAKPYQPNFDE
ncbi:MAG: type I methionyl aminopeptidase [Halobacteriovoraceae bacterium]|nr:type I methionyl aminopeptidase [Halobacteriovoraceae bacterium]|tara:strand:+ start:2927 stop:3709 length:783 start_codon:yes stop_codon:yes gene_type:complete